jgi:hypothetical protein
MSLWNVQTSLVLSTFEGNTATTRKGTRGLTVRRFDRRSRLRQFGETSTF